MKKHQFRQELLKFYRLVLQFCLTKTSDIETRKSHSPIYYIIDLLWKGKENSEEMSKY